MIDFENTKLEALAIHRIENPQNNGNVFLSQQLTEIVDQQLKTLLFQYFLGHFQNPESFRFLQNETEEESNVYRLAKEIFDAPGELLTHSQKIAQQLFDATSHPNIKDGDLFVAYFSQINFNDEITDAIGIFKAESISAFLKILREDSTNLLNHDQGIHVTKPDKACLIFNTEQPDGFRIYLRDTVNVNYEAQYWRESFLGVTPCSDNYHYTQNMLDITRSFVKQKLNEDFDVEKADEIDLLNKTISYFKDNESFDKDEYGQRILGDQKVVESFNKYAAQCANEMDIDVIDEFEISYPAVKKQARIFKSVLKLDKNFHIYIHGDRSKISKGVESDGKRFYKVYYENEA